MYSKDKGFNIVCQGTRRIIYRILVIYTIYNNARREGCSRVRGIYTKPHRTVTDAEECNNSYINQIENKKALPSLQGLFYICEYFGITPQQFFDDGSAYPAQLADLVEDMKKLDAASLEHIAAIVKEMVGNK